MNEEDYYFQDELPPQIDISSRNTRLRIVPTPPIQPSGHKIYGPKEDSRDKKIYWKTVVHRLRTFPKSITDE